MLRVRSAPANISLMTHSFKTKVTITPIVCHVTQPESAEDVAPENPIDKIMCNDVYECKLEECEWLPVEERDRCRDAALSEIVTSIASDAQIMDPTEQLLLTMVANQLTTNTREIDYRDLLRSVLLRMATSVIMHKCMTVGLSLHHNRDAVEPMLRHMLSGP